MRVVLLPFSRDSIVRLFGRPESWVLVISFVFGVLFLLVTPPFMVPDEYDHFFRSYHVSEGHLLQDRNLNDYGGMLPSSLVKTSSEVSHELKQHPENKQDLQNISSLLGEPLKEKEKTWVSFPVVQYSALSYLPQSFGVFFGRSLGLSPLLLFYLARIANFSFWVCLIYFSVKIVPVMKWTMLALAFTPMSFYMAVSVSPDVSTNALSFFLIALFFYYAAQSERKLGNTDILLLFVVSTLVALSKFAYSPLILLYFLMPISRLGDKKRYFGVLILLVLTAGSFSLGWTLFVKALWSQSLSPNDTQLSSILLDPMKLIIVVINTFGADGQNLLNHFIGVLGWLDTVLPGWFVQGYYEFLFAVALLDRSGSASITWKSKAICAFALIGGVSTIALLVYYAFTPVGVDMIVGLQGRYFIPLSPLFFFLFNNKLIFDKTSRWLQFDIRAWGMLVPAFSAYGLAIAIRTLIGRFYLI